MRCEVAQRGLSEAMDGAASVSPQIDAHRRSCAACTRFEEGAWQIRGLVRIDPSVPPVPDMVAAVMQRIEDYEADRMLGWIPDPHPFRTRLQAQRFVLAALVTGLILGIVLTSGGLIPIGNEGSVAKAEEIPAQLVRAAKELRGYAATLDITELHWTRTVAQRTFVATLAFREPESFKVEVRDTTPYPSSEWPRNNLRLVTDGHTWQATGPDLCPAAALPVCPHPEPVKRSVINRAPFDSRSSMPTDAIVPMTVLAASDRIAVIGPDQVAGRKAVAIDLTYQDGASLFQYLRFLGSWRPFFPQDRVVLWLDQDTWFPLKYEVFPAPGPVRSAWASQLGLPGESSDNWIFKAEVRSFSLGLPRADVFRVTPGREANSEGFRDLTFPKPLGPPYPPGDAELMTPRVTEGLTHWRFGRFTRTDERPYRETLMAYASGLSWFTVTRVVGWDQPAMFGVGPFTETVRMPNGGTGYYDPATDSDPRRVALHTGDGEFLVATNLPRAGLIRIAGSLAVRGRPAPAAWRIHRWSGGSVMEGLTLREAAGRTPFPVLVPTYLPAGFRIAATETVRASGIAGVTLVFRRPAAELDGFGLHLYQASGQTLPPPTDADQQVVMVGRLTGRWSPQDHLLEWMDGAIYRSLQGPELDLGTLVHVAESLRRATSRVSPPGASP